jgi:hypothetical protein
MKFLACLALGLAAATAYAVSPEPPVEASTETPADPVKDETPGAADRAFAEALAGCRPASHEGPHPFVKGFVIEHQITGESGSTCTYTQTMPGGMTMDCKLSSDGRAALAGEFREMAEGRMSGGTASQPSWTRECEIVTQDGKRMPMQSG